MGVTYTEIAAAIATTLGEIDDLARVQHGDDLTEDYPDLPMAQVYPQSSSTDEGAGGNNDRNTFRGVGRVTEALFRADIPCRQRSHVAEDMTAVMAVAEAVQTKLEEQRTRPIFGLEGIKGFRWSWERQTIRRGADPAPVFYAGLIVSIWVRVF